MEHPIFPLISIDTKYGAFDIIENAAAFSKASTRILINATYFDRVNLFDKNNSQWKYRQLSADLKNNWVTKFLAKTVYNPVLDTEVTWIPNGFYQMKELKEKLKDCVDRDGDTITQFEEADIIKIAIEKAVSFDEILNVLNKYVFDVDEEQLWREQKARGE
ncbi:MAG TPA: hypothetical protein VF630_19290 [Hymenobacter sp.]|jgi:hypothetical protein